MSDPNIERAERLAEGAMLYCEGMLSWRQHWAPQDEAAYEFHLLGAQALRAVIALRKRYTGCQRYTSGFGSCFRNGHTIDAEFGADQVCEACIVDRALQTKPD